MICSHEPEPSPEQRYLVVDQNTKPLPSRQKICKIGMDYWDGLVRMF